MKLKPSLGLVPLFGLLLAGTSGCVTYPISKPVRMEAAATRELTFSETLRNPDAHHGAVVIWGGKIIQTVNDTNGAEVYMMEVPLDRYERPVSDHRSQGRFIARTSGFLDPELYGKGSVVTVAGTVTGSKTEPLDRIQYTYPVLDVKEMYLWVPRLRSYHPYPPYGWWGWDGYGPYWRYDYNWYYPPYFYQEPERFYRPDRDQDRDRDEDRDRGRSSPPASSPGREEKR